MTTTTQGRPTAKRLGGGALMLLGVALIGYGAHYLIRNGNCSSTGYTEYGPVPRCGGSEALYIMSVFFLGPGFAVIGWLMSRTWGWLWPLTCVSLAVGLATIKIDSAAAAGAKTLGLILGICFTALAVLSAALTTRKRLRRALPNAGVARVDPGLPPSGPQDPSAWPPKEDPLDRIAKLARLHESGALTDTEFEREKAKILSQM
jgi:hypothetical protein